MQSCPALCKNRIRNKTTVLSRSKHPGVVKVCQFSSSKHRDTPVVNSRDTEFGSVVLNIQLETPLSFLQFTIVPETEKWWFLVETYNSFWCRGHIQVWTIFLFNVRTSSWSHGNGHGHHSQESKNSGCKARTADAARAIALQVRAETTVKLFFCRKRKDQLSTPS